MAHGLGVGGRVHFHPAVAQDQLLALSAAADGGVVPYQANCLNNFYCTPNKLFEFIAAGTPIVASDLPEIRNIVVGRGLGMVGDTSTPESFALLIDQFFADEERITTWRSNLAKARKVLSWEREGAKVVAIYEALR
jgi:glycosyltransferase involved in cell wall biosynthesis